ncbi:MAG TPA: carboxypeptidase regulatory-like domain-containing protein [Bryobacterales bacterium]|nr:carboxypeptidase regulatory-like domain-containing protein [Bryobacterales bacterium]
MSANSVLRGVLLALLAATLSFAQQITGSITGTVMDPAGAAVANAQVKLTNTGTGAVENAITDESGNFRFLLLPPGTYSLEASAPGFKLFRRDGIIVEVDRSLAVPVALQIGQVTETVEVQGGTPLLEPNTSSLGTVMEEKKVEDLPLNGRNPMGLANLIPTVRGIGYFGGQVLSSWRLAAVGIGGGQPLTNGYLVDGIANDKMVDSGPMTFLTVDDTEEFKVQTNSMSAEFGRTTGGVISMISKSGTNELHGSLFEFLRNDKLNANDFFANKAGRKIAPDKVNQFGGTLGGPIIKNKLFYFFNYEGYRERSASIETITSPTAAQRAGDFSGLTTSTGQLITIYDPTTTVPDPSNPGRFIRSAFPGNKIPADRINLVGQNILSYYPQPNLPGLSSNLFLTGATPINKDTETIRLDYNISPTKRLAGRFTDDRLAWQFANFFNNIADVDGRLISIPRRNAFISYTDSFSPTLLFDSRIGFSHQTEAYSIPSQGFDITKLGLPASLLAQSQNAPNAPQGVFPRLSVSDLTTFGGTAAAANHTNTGSASATLTKIRGSQTWKFGYEFRLYQRNEFTLNSPVGSYTFNRGFTQGPNPDQASATAGYSVASLLLGTPASAFAGINASSAVTLRYNALFFQDDWKVSRKLTLNLGLRWDKDGAPTERYNRYENFDPDVASPLKAPGLTLRGGLVYSGVNGHPRAFYTSPSKDFQPRFGFAYQLQAKTVLRGGFGIMFVPTTQGQYTPSQIGFSSTTPMVTSNDGGRTPANTLSNPFPNGLTPPTGASLGALTGIGTGVTGQLYNQGRGYSEQWNFTIQHQPWENWLVEVGYMGNRGVHLFMYNQDIDWLPNQALSLGSALGQTVPNPFYGVITSGPLAAAQVPQYWLMLPFPQYAYTSLPTSQGGVISPISYLNNSIYHALTVKVEKRFSRGFSLLASYAASKLLDLGDNLTQVRPGGVSGYLVQNWNNLSAERSKSLYDVPQRLVVTALWDVPLGKSGNPLYRAVAGGWQLNAITTLQSGLPIPLGANLTGVGNRPSVVAGVSDKASSQSLSQWFNTAAFTAPAPYSYGNASRTLPDVLSDGLFSMDFSAFKNFSVREKYQFQFRAEAFNLTNTPTFEVPGTMYGSPTFGQVTATAFTPKPRVIQFGLKLRF